MQRNKRRKNGLLVPALAMLVVGLIAPTVEAVPFACGPGDHIMCEWTADGQFDARFVLRHDGPVNVTHDPRFPLFGNDYTSPSEFWKVSLTALGEFDFVGGDRVKLIGIMQHIKKPTDHPRDDDFGGKFNFELEINAVAGMETAVTPVPSKKPHNPHEDFFNAVLTGTRGGANFDKYGAVISGGHVPVPEPSTLLLLGSGLAGLIAFGRKAPQ